MLAAPYQSGQGCPALCKATYLGLYRALQRVDSSKEYPVSPLRLLPIAALLAAVPVVAQTVPTEVFTLDAVDVTLHLHPFLTDEESTTLRVVGQSPDALALFLPAGNSFGAIALAPKDGFIRDGQPVDSASAVADLPDAAQARDAALMECNAARTGGPSCVIVLEIAPR